MNVKDAIIERRSIKHFDRNHEMTEDEKTELMNLAMLSPTSFNMQNWRFVLVDDKNLKEEIKKASFGQNQVADSSILIILCADLKAWEKEPKRYFRNAPEEVQNSIVQYMNGFYNGNERVQRDEAFRSCGIAAQTIMLAAKGMGYDSCAMAGYDSKKVAELINLPEDYIITMFVVVGKKVKEAQPKDILEYGDVVIKNKF
ncbi:MAG: nitroreductase family protein [Melioribacteraceae bacterium]|nr:nitroreductase family protein [Melioribacteraceae bacterium]